MDIRDDALLDLFERNQPAVLMRLAAQSGMRPSLEDPDRDASISLALGNVDGPRQDPEGEQA